VRRHGGQRAGRGGELIPPGRRLHVDVPAALDVVGIVTKYLSFTALVPAAVAVGYGEPVWPFLAAGALAFGFGVTLQLTPGRKDRVGAREAFLIVALTWVVAAGFGALPYLLSGEPQLSNPVDAYFEAMSGFTTTGASVLTDIEALPRSLLLWRQLTQWLGGMGIIVLALAVLPRLRIGGRQLLESELPGPELEPLATRVRDTARRLWILYLGLTVLAALAYAATGWLGQDARMDLFNAVAHALATLPTGGFSPLNVGAAAFAPVTQWLMVVFMLAAGTNFALMYRAFVRHQPAALTRDEEFRLYLGVLALAAGIIGLDLLSEGTAEGEAAIRHAVFQTVSMMTSTGFASTDFALWPAAAAMALVGLMFIGGSAGSTSGSVKVVRHLLTGRMLRREADLTMHPELISPIRLNRSPVDERTLRGIQTFVVLYVGIFVVGAVLLQVDAARAGVQLSVFEAVAAAATTLGNVGPGVGFAGPFGNFEPFSDVSTALMIGLMWLGRLELIPVLVLFSRHFWRA
jgi:trk system potassium uptake protein TrkH